MAKRRGNQEGSIYQRKDGRWCAQVSLNGRRLTHYAKTQRECREWLKKTLAQIDEGLTFDAAQATVRSYLKHWLETVKPQLRPETYRHYTHIVLRYVTPELGDIKLKDLRPDHIQALYAARREAGTSESMMDYLHSVLRRALGHAFKWGLIPRNPVSVVESPKPKRVEMKVWDADQVRIFLNATEGDRFEALYLMAVTTGMRMGELLGLRWSDLDWETGRLHVQRQLQHVVGEGLVLVEPKTRTGRRPIALGPSMLAKLLVHRERQQQERLFSGEDWQEHGLIFPSLVGTPKGPSELRREFKRLAKQAGLPEIRFHDLRHTAATLMLQQGVHPKVVQERLGHSSINITLDIYSHVFPNLQEDAAGRLEDLLF
jgi:integrase